MASATFGVNAFKIQTQVPAQKNEWRRQTLWHSEGYETLRSPVHAGRPFSGTQSCCEPRLQAAAFQTRSATFSHQLGAALHGEDASKNMVPLLRLRKSWQPAKAQNSRSSITARAAENGALVSESVTTKYPPEKPNEISLGNPNNGLAYSASVGLPSQNGAAFKDEVRKADDGTRIQLDNRNYPLEAGADLEVAEFEDSSEQGDTFTKYSGYIFDQADGEANTWPEYDQAKIARYYQARPLLLARRLVQIATTLGVWLGKRWLDSKRGRSTLMFKKRAAQLRAAIMELGPAFVKIGQAVSSRPDVIPPEFLKELEKLQDRIPPFPTDVALDIIEEDLGVPIETLFSEISPEPIAAASLGQVYQARLRPNGQEVAVKVQRPGVMAAIALDVYILRLLAGVARQYGRLNTDLQAVVDEWAGSLFKEMDYTAEARNGLRFKKLFGGIDNVMVPSVYPELTSKRVLIMEWVEGQRLSDGGVTSEDLRMVEVGVYCSLSQLLDSGFYHADPHPGNLLRTPDGKLAYLDFGMMGEIKQNLREGLIEACVHLVNREFNLLAKDFVTLGLLPPTADMSAVAPALTGVFQSAISEGVRNISFGDLSGDLGRTMYNFNFRIPAYFSLVIRSLTVLEGIALASDRNYKVLGAAYPWIAKKVLTDRSPALRATLKELLYQNGSFRFDRLESLLRESQRPMFEPDETAVPEGDKDRRLLKKVLKFALSAEGEFVRDALLTELTKGLDAYNRAAFDSVVSSIRTSFPSLPLPVPELSEPEDDEALVNLRKFAALLTSGSASAAEAAPERVQRVTAVGDDVIVASISRESQEPVRPQVGFGDLSRAVEQAQALTKYIPQLTVIAELPLNAQQQAVLLPLELAGRLFSRATARTIRQRLSTPPSRRADMDILEIDRIER